MEKNCFPIMTSEWLRCLKGQCNEMLVFLSVYTSLVHFQQQKVHKLTAYRIYIYCTMINLADVVLASSIMWVTKYLDTTEREWKHTFEFFSKQRNMRAFLRSKFELGELPACMPTYYMSAIKNWSSLSESTTDKIACQSLRCNKELKIGTNSAYNNNLYSIGIWYVGDLFEGGHVISFETYGGGVVPKRPIGWDDMVWYCEVYNQRMEYSANLQ